MIRLARQIEADGPPFFSKLFPAFVAQHLLPFSFLLGFMQVLRLAILFPASLEAPNTRCQLSANEVLGGTRIDGLKFIISRGSPHNDLRIKMEMRSITPNVSAFL